MRYTPAEIFDLLQLVAKNETGDDLARVWMKQEMVAVALVPSSSVSAVHRRGLRPIRRSVLAERCQIQENIRINHLFHDVLRSNEG